MFDFVAFFGSLLICSVVVLIVLLLGFGFYLMCECGNPWGFVMVVGAIIFGISIAIGFVL